MAVEDSEALTRPQSPLHAAFVESELSGDILDVERAAELLLLRPKTIRSLASARIIPGAKIGKAWRFHERLLREWLVAKSKENMKQCLSTNAPTLSIGRSGSSSLGARLDELLEKQTEPPPRSSRKSFAVISGGKSS